MQYLDTNFKACLNLDMKLKYSNNSGKQNCENLRFYAKLFSRQEIKNFKSTKPIKNESMQNHKNKI